MGLAAYLLAAANGAILLVAFVVAVLIIYACVRMAKNKGYSSWLGFFLGFFLGIIGLIIVAVLPRKIESTGNLGARYCQSCGQPVTSGTRFCASCGAAA